jgi:hypothetical protein
MQLTYDEEDTCIPSQQTTRHLGGNHRPFTPKKKRKRGFNKKKITSFFTGLRRVVPIVDRRRMIARNTHYYAVPRLILKLL